MEMAADAPLLFIIGSGDESDRIAHAGGTRITVKGASDLHKLLQEREPYELLHISRNFFRQTRETRLLHYNVLVNLITEAEKGTKTLDNLAQAAARCARPHRQFARCGAALDPRPGSRAC